MTHHDPAAAVALTLERGDPWLTVFLVAALVLCGAHKADRVMVAGRWRVVDGAIPGLDVAALRRAHGAASRRYA